MSVIEFRGVHLALGQRPILSGVNLDIGAREFIGVLGPNGAGKTTLMRAVLGLVPPSRGTIHVLGRPAARGNPAVGYMPQVRGAVATMRLSGWDFVAAVVDGHRMGLPVIGRAGRAEVARGDPVTRAVNDSRLAPVASSTLARLSLLGQRARPSGMRRLLGLNVVASRPARLARPEADRPCSAASVSSARQISSCFMAAS